MRAYSMDLRTRAVDAVRRKEGSYEQLAERFRVSVSWIKKMVYQQRRLGHLQVQTHRCGRKPKLSQADRERLARLVEQYPDATLERLKEQLGVDCCIQTIWKALRRMRRTFKKDVASRRAGPAGRDRRPQPAPPPWPAARGAAAAVVR